MYTNNVLSTFKILSCDGWDFAGKFNSNEKIQRTYSFASNIKGIRVRISYFIFGIWNENDAITLTIDGN